MNLNTSSTRWLGALTAALSLLSFNASAQADYHHKPIKIVVPFPAGGT